MIVIIMTHFLGWILKKNNCFQLQGNFLNLYRVLLLLGVPVYHPWASQSFINQPLLYPPPILLHGLPGADFGPPGGRQTCQSRDDSADNGRPGEGSGARGHTPTDSSQTRYFHQLLILLPRKYHDVFLNIQDQHMLTRYSLTVNCEFENMRQFLFGLFLWEMSGKVFQRARI